MRRVFLIIGLLYMYRAVTMWVTALPKADKNYECAEKFGGPLTFAELFKRVVKIVTGSERESHQEFNNDHGPQKDVRYCCDAFNN